MIKCPQCRKPVAWEGNLNRPFCSERCRLLDLGNWASENYRIASDERANQEESDSENTF